jgi:SOS-response transcriptional repressor LexA
LDGVVTLAQNQDGELTLKLMRYVDGVWELHSLNPAYGNASAEQWSIIGHAIYHEGGDLSGIRV